MRVLVTGANGQLGFDVIRQLNSLNIECMGIDRENLDITIELDVNRFIEEYKPSIIIHCAAYTAVDKAEVERNLCYDINVLGTKYLVHACKKMDITLVYISTDYVFDGQGSDFFETTDAPNPINYYGLSKYKGELEVANLLTKFFIIRTSWVFGLNGNNFVKTMLKIAEGKMNLSVVSDQIGSPTYTFDLAKLICEMIKTTRYGIYHGTNEGLCGWNEFAEEIFKIMNIDIKVNAISSAEYPTKARRPFNSRLSKQKLDENGFERLPNWKDALERYLQEI